MWKQVSDFVKPSILKKKQDTCCFGVGNSDNDSLQWGFQYLSSTAAERVWDFPSQVRWPQVSCRRICLKLAGLHTCQLSLIQSETQATAPSKIRLQSEKEWENRPNFNQIYIYIYICYHWTKFWNNKLPHYFLLISLNCPIWGWQVCWFASQSLGWFCVVWRQVTIEQMSQLSTLMVFLG